MRTLFFSKKLRNRLVRRVGFDRKGVYGAAYVFAEKIVDHAMSLNGGLSFEHVGNDHHLEVITGAGEVRHFYGTVGHIGFDGGLDILRVDHVSLIS